MKTAFPITRDGKTIGVATFNKSEKWIEVFFRPDSGLASESMDFTGNVTQMRKFIKDVAPRSKVTRGWVER